MSNPQCAVSVRDVGTPHGGEIRPYRSTQTTGRWMLCDAHAQGAPGRGIWWLVPDDVDGDHEQASCPPSPAC